MQTISAAKVVIDENDRYVTVVQMMDPQGNELKTPYKFELTDGQRVIDAKAPTIRQYAGKPGFVDPLWDADTTTWIENATAEEIAAWEKEHPAPASLQATPTDTQVLNALLGVSGNE